MQRLDCHVKEYAWGKRGGTSEVARLFAAGHKSFQIGQKTPYAELWMGTHPDGPARIRQTNERLSSLIAQSDSASYLLNNNGSQTTVDEIHLPFIMKIMSIKHTLSLQVHPTKEQAVRLHKRDPKNYPDSHHKPELAYALTRFELLCGFRPASEIVQNMKAFPELGELMGYDNQKKFELLYHNGVAQETIQMKNALRECFAKMMYAQVERPNEVRQLLESMKNRIEKGVRGCLIEDTIKVMEQTWDMFPGDVGCFAPLYLNHLILHPGECCFYAAEELHAYLSGECVECVGCSNNTIRAALTPKFIDRKTLIDVLNYRMTDPSFYIVEPKVLKNHKNVVEYAPDCKDFTLHQIKIEENQHKVIADLPTLQCASIMVIVSGHVRCQELKLDEKESLNWVNATMQKGERGDIFYIPPQQQVRLVNLSNEEVLAYRTFSYEIGPDHSKRLKHFAIDKKHAHPLADSLHDKAIIINSADYFDETIEMDGFI